MLLLLLVYLSLVCIADSSRAQDAAALTPPATSPTVDPLAPWTSAFPEVPADNATDFECSRPEDLDEDWEGFVLTGLSDGRNAQKRCATVIRPVGQKKLGVVFCFHGSASSGTDNQCATRLDDQGSTLGSLAMKSGFALVILQHAPNATSWDLPLGPAADKWLTNVTTTRCDSSEMSYWAAVMDQLSMPMRKGDFATDKIYPLGLSLGAMMATNAAVCLRELNKDWPRNKESYVTSFAAHSIGVFTEGDHRFPVYPGPHTQLKACVSGGSANRVNEVDFHTTSLSLAEQWEQSGNRVERLFLEGGNHDEVESWNKLINCLDDTSGRLYATVRDAHPQLFMDMSDA